MTKDMIKRLLQGGVIGLANIIPGVSGGTMMVVMGLYDKLIHCITHLRSEFKKSVKFLLPIFAGAGLSLVIFAKIIEYCFANFPIQTNLLFCGLIAGSLPIMFRQVKGRKISPGMVIAFLIFFILVCAMAWMGETKGNAAEVTLNLINVIKLFGVGVIAAATMVIPGVSGSMMLMIMGYYTVIINEINSFVHALLRIDIPGVFHHGLVLFPFGVGVIVGIFLIAKAIEIIFEKARTHAYWAIIGLITASPLAILGKTDWSSLSFLTGITGILLFAAGWFVASKLSD